MSLWLCESEAPQAATQKFTPRSLQRGAVIARRQSRRGNPDHPTTRHSRRGDPV